MKKIIYYLFALLFLSACADSDLEVITPPVDEGPKGSTRVTMSFSAAGEPGESITIAGDSEALHPNSPSLTRAAGTIIDNYLDDVWVLLYNGEEGADNGKLIEAYYTDRILQDTDEETGELLNTWRAVLDMDTPYDQVCYIYCIANTHDKTFFKWDDNEAVATAGSYNTINQLMVKTLKLNDPADETLPNDAIMPDVAMWNSPTDETRPGLIMRGAGVEPDPDSDPLDIDEFPSAPLVLGENLEVMLYRMAARIDLKLLNPTVDLKEVTIDGIRLCNVPSELGYMHTADDLTGGGYTYTYIDYPLVPNAKLPELDDDGYLNYTWYIPRHLLATHDEASEDVSTYIEVQGSVVDEYGKTLRRSYRYYPNQEPKEEPDPEEERVYNFNLDASQHFTMEATIKGIKTSTLETNKFWSVGYIADTEIVLDSDANAIIVRSDDKEHHYAGGVFTFDIAPQINKYGSYLATQSLAASSVSATHATQVIAANAEWTAEIVWQTAPGLITLLDAKGNPITSETSAADKVLGKGPTGNIRFTLSKADVQGNALIAVRDNTTNKIVWSWHLWVLNHDPGTTSYIPVNSDITQKNKRYTLLNYNLGATTNQLGSGLAAYGLLYQWGRKDPFPNGETASSDISTLYFKGDGSGYTWPEVYATPTGFNHLAQSVSRPDQFIPYLSSGANTWLGSTASSAILATAGQQGALSWGGHDGGSTYTIATYGSYQSADKTVFDPCPAGYRVPPTAAFDKALDDAYNTQAINFNAGFDWSTYYNGTSYTATGPGIFSAGGRRGDNTGALLNQGASGFYWSASLSNDTNGYSLYLYSGAANPRGSYNRANGCGVRCVCL